jgi:superfamily II DNA or RNA helicase
MDSLIAASTADITILPYQLEPALALVSGVAARMLIADEVGLGKTVQAGLIIAETLARHDGHVLVLCPSGLRAQWTEELTERFHLAPVVLDSAALQRFPQSDQANPWAAHPLIVTSMDYIKRPEVIRPLEPLVWDVLVIDEAHGIAGNSDRHSAATLLAQRARTLVMLTATPHSGDEAAFIRLTATGDLENAFPLLVFRRTRADTSRPSRRSRWLRVGPTAAELRMHRALLSYVRQVWRHPASAGARLAMIVLMRRACSSAASLARSVERRLALLADDMEPNQLQLPLAVSERDDAEPEAEIAAPGLNDSRDERHRLETILTLARRASESSSKIAALTRLLRRSREAAIVFTEYRDTLTALERGLPGFATCQLHGGLTAAERREVIRTFTSGKGQVLLATDAASEGLNLQQRCRLVVHLEVPWSPARIEQRVGRVDRIGQARRVHQVQLVAAGTIEEVRVAAVVQRALHAASTLNSLSAPKDERQIAACVIGNEDFPEPSVGVLPPGLITGNLRAKAVGETARLVATRRLRPHGSSMASSSTDVRPFVSSGRRLPRGWVWWALWLECADSNGQLVWETLAGAQHRHHWPPPHSAREARAFADRSWKHARNRVLNDGRFADSLGAWLQTAGTLLAREKAIARGIEERRGRMAASLVQRALFDHRAEREAISQRELLQQALSRCRMRIEELHRRQTATEITSRPAFALITW